jgi:hypothetical protein
MSHLKAELAALLRRTVSLVGSVVLVLGFSLCAVLLSSILLEMMGANERALFVRWILSLAAGVAAPFEGAFRDVSVPGAGKFVSDHALALAVYVAVVLGAVKALRRADAWLRPIEETIPWATPGESSGD